MRIRTELLAIGLVIVAFAGGTIFMVLAISEPRNPPEFATILPQTVPLPSFELTDHRGQRISRDVFDGQWSLVFFGFTHCPDICPATLQQLAIARERLIANGDETPSIVLVSVDPERDTPETLTDYIDHFGPGVTGITGPLDELGKLTAALGIYFAKSATSETAYNVDHSAVVLVVTPEAELRAIFRAPHKIDHFVADLPRIVDGS